MKSLLSSLLLLIAIFKAAEADITIVQTGKRLLSKPDRRLGERLWKGYEYMGRLQYVNGNLLLCGHETWNITVPHDGLPGEYETSVAIFSAWLL
jgi:hypothetical protein